MAAPTLEIICAVCTCGQELSTLHYLLTAGEQFDEFASTYDIPVRDAKNIGFIRPDQRTTLEQKLNAMGLNFCCLMSLRYGTRAPVAVIENAAEQTANQKYPEGLPAPLSRERTLTSL